MIARLQHASRRCARRGACVVLAVLGSALPAQLPELARGERFRETGRLALEQAVRDASSDNLALIVAAHPDDRWVMPAAYLRFEHGMRVAVLLFTRGGGGQNSSGPETGHELAKLRTMEVEASADRLGAKVYYLNRPDSGYSRTAAETLAEWDESSTVRDVTRLIRLIKPDIVLTTHHAGETHGHDLALLEVLPQAVERSADPDFEAGGLPAFVVSRLFRGATPEEEDEATASLSMDTTDETRGATYRELAYRALEEHRSQAPLQAMDVLFQPILDLVSIPIGDQPRHRTLLNQLPDVFQSLHEAIPDFDSKQLGREHFEPLRAHLADLPELSTAALALAARLRTLKVAPGTDAARRLRRRMDAVDRILVCSAAVRVFMRVPKGVEAAAGDELPLQIWIGNEGHHTVTGLEIEALNGGRIDRTGQGRGRTTLESQDSLAIEARYRPPDLSGPALDALFARDTFERPLRLRFKFAVDGHPVAVEEVIPTDLQPAVKITVTPKTLLMPTGVHGVPFVVAVERKASRPLDLTLRIKPPQGVRVRDGVQQVKLQTDERFREFTFYLDARQSRPGAGAMHVWVGAQRIRVNVHKVDVRVRDDLRVGLIPGVDNTSHDVLEALVGKRRLEVFESDRTLPILDQRLHTIVVDVRALRSRKARSGFARLLEWVEKGGRLVVFYHKDVEFNLKDAHFNGAPFPLVIGKGRVTREDAPVRLLVPDHDLFRFPNRIQSDHWDGWQQERGLYFPAEYDTKQFTELLEMNDPGQPPERGSLLYARYGKGEYVYCALSLWRQLKARHAGACRLFANLVSPRPR